MKKYCIFCMVLLCVYLISCNRQGCVYWNGIQMSEDFVPPPKEEENDY